jgi:uncharacterized damage-inducible protein DinB
VQSAVKRNRVRFALRTGYRYHCNSFFKSAIMSTTTLLHSLFKYKAWSNDQLFVELAKVDAVAQQEARHNAMRIVNHIYVVDQIFAAHLSGAVQSFTATNTVETPTLEALRDGVAMLDAWYVDYSADLSTTQLAENIAFTFTDGDTGHMSREEMLTHVSLHGAYHRGGAGRIMAQVSVPPPRDLYTRFLHQTEPARRAF